jgi:hypothetical protein
MAAAGRICPRCLEPQRECICPDEDDLPDDTPEAFSVPFLAPPETGA